MGEDKQMINTFLHKPSFVEIMDTTLRDGEQTSGVSFLPHEKLMIAKTLLNDLNVDRLEIASARVSNGEKDAVKMICRYARQNQMIDRIEVLGFVDGHDSIDWIKDCGCQTINLLCKGSFRHCTLQLKKTPEEHIEDIKRSLDYARRQEMNVNVYLEDWSNGMIDSPEYVFQVMDALYTTSIKRFLLPDTLGILNPLQVLSFVGQMVERYPHVHFDFHAHNDYDMSVGNTFAAVCAGAKGVHVTVNGLGERCGNAPLASIQVLLKDQLHVKTSIDESRLNEVSRLIESYSGIAIAPNQPVVGENVFTQVAGVHADGDRKDNLYNNALLPQRFGRQREYALGKNSGKANILQNLDELGLELTAEQIKKVTQRITELGDKKQIVTHDDLPYIVNDVLKHAAPDEKVKLLSYMVSTAHGLRPFASAKIQINGVEYEEYSDGDGQFDAFVHAIRKIYKTRLLRKFPMLTNYSVTIPPGGRTDALVQTVISWQHRNKIVRSRGLDADQTEAAIKATIKMLNLIEDDFDAQDAETATTI